MTSTERPALDFTPGPGRAPMRTIVARQTAMEIRLVLRSGETLAIAVVLPILGLLGVGLTDVVRLPVDDRLGFVAPGAIALALMSSAFTAQAIATGYERGYGVLKRLGASSLTSFGLITAKTTATVLIVATQTVALTAVALGLGWRPRLAGLLPAVGLILLATAAFTGLALLLAGTMRAEATAGIANLVFLVLLVGGGLFFPLPVVGAGLELLPTTALAEGLRGALGPAGAVPVWCWYSLASAAVLASTAAARAFKWQ